MALLALALVVSAPTFGPMALQAFAIVNSGSLLAPFSRATATLDMSARVGAGGQSDAQATCISGGRNVFGEHLVIERGAWICGDVTAYRGDITIAGRVDGNVRAVGGNITIIGEVRGDVTALAGNVNLQSDARVTGAVDALGGNVNRSAGVQTTGARPLAATIPASEWLWMYRFSWWWLLFWGLAGAGIAWLFPERIAHIKTIAVSQFLANLAVGLVSLVVGAAFVVLLTITCIGALVAVPLAAALWVGWVIGTVALGSWLGDRLTRSALREEPHVVLVTVFGVILLAALEQIPLVGAPLAIVVGIVGLGATLRVMLFAQRKRRLLRRIA